LSQFPKVFDRLYVNMVKAGEMSGSLETSLARLAQFMEKAEHIKGRVKTALIYPVAVLVVAGGVVALMLLVLVPKLKEVLDGLNGGHPLPAFTRFVLGVSDAARHNFAAIVLITFALFCAFRLTVRTARGRRWFDLLKLRMPALGPVFRKAAIARFTR